MLQPEIMETNISIDLLVPNPYQPRKKFNDNSINDLAVSIKTYGIINPILVRKKNEKYEIVAGERRYRAAKLVGLTEVPVLIRNIDDNKMAELALIENLQRENLSPIDEAKSYTEILKRLNITEQKLSEMIGKSQSFISNKIRLLNLPQNVQEALINKQISERHARSLLTVKDDARKTELLELIINEKLTVKELDNLINQKQITEEEIQTAINDIMKSLNIAIEENQKEEKESDNMNNGSFFPNMNNNPGMNPNANLGGIPQAMPTGPVPMMQPAGVVPEAAPVQMPQAMPTVEPAATLPEVAPSPIPNMGTPVEPVPAAMPTMEPAPASAPVEPIPNFVAAPVEPVPAAMPTMEPAVAPAEPAPVPAQEPAAMTAPETAPMIDIPLFSEQNLTPAPEPAPVPAQEPETPAVTTVSTETPVADPPLFGASEPAATPIEVAPAPAVDIPVVAESPVPEMVQDNITKIKEFLNSNNINYKVYSNETGHCIVIE